MVGNSFSPTLPFSPAQASLLESPSIRTLPRCLAPRQSRPSSPASHDHLSIPPPDLTAMPDQTMLGRYPSRTPLHDAAGPTLLLWWQRHAISLIAAACHRPSPSPSIALGRQRWCQQVLAGGRCPGKFSLSLVSFAVRRYLATFESTVPYMRALYEVNPTVSRPFLPDQDHIHSSSCLHKSSPLPEVGFHPSISFPIPEAHYPQTLFSGLEFSCLRAWCPDRTVAGAVLSLFAKAYRPTVRRQMRSLYSIGNPRLLHAIYSSALFTAFLFRPRLPLNTSDRNPSPRPFRPPKKPPANVTRSSVIIYPITQVEGGTLLSPSHTHSVAKRFLRGKPDAAALCC